MDNEVAGLGLTVTEYEQLRSTVESHLRYTRGGNAPSY